MNDLHRTLGLEQEKAEASFGGREDLIRYINLKLASMGAPTYGEEAGYEFLSIAHDLLQHHQEKSRLLSDYLCPADQRIQNFIDSHLSDGECKEPPRLPSETFILDRHGLARELSLPPDRNTFSNPFIQSYRVTQGVLHNPLNDRRTTKGVFHVAQGGLPIPNDKTAVPKRVFALLLGRALDPPRELLELPFTDSQPKKASLFVSLLLRPVVCPEVPGFIKKKSMEIRFFAPGSMVSNLHFVESIFGNGGDPFLPKNDAGLDVEGWTGHTGCVILAPHLTTITKKELGIPSLEEATEAEREAGHYYRDENEKYNNGQAFKITCRTEEGVMVTLIADNYFGYCKKEVKTQISYSANLFGLCEEEHAGGAIAFPSYNLGDIRIGDHIPPGEKRTTIEEIHRLFGGLMELEPEGYGRDINHEGIFYIPHDTRIDINQRTLCWTHEEKKVTIPLKMGATYIYPSGYKVHLAKHPKAPSWHLVGTVAEGTFCHKPCTVSGGGKSEISKSVSNAMIYGPLFVADLQKDLERIESIINRDVSSRFRHKLDYPVKHRPLLSFDRSLGSTIRMLTPSPTEFTDDYNRWLESIPDYLKALVLLIKRLYKPEWGENWKEHFGVDIVNGSPGHEFKYGTRKVVAGYLRIGISEDGSWRTFKVRQDYVPSEKIQLEDDISASIVVPRKALSDREKEGSIKFAINCEYRLFQRPDDAIVRGFDKDAESDLALPGSFLSNFEPLPREKAQKLIDDAIGFEEFTPPMKDLIKKAALQEEGSYFVSSAHPRIVEGKPTKNIRYLQIRPDLLNARQLYIAEIGSRLARRIPLDRPFYRPVNAVLPGRRNNPPDRKAGIRSLSVYNPIHYQRLPELFMDFICSLTGKSPSTTGAGSEGALTKSPFNALSPVTDLNNALVGFILTGYQGYTTAAGHIGSRYQVDHDISLLIPELWSRLTEKERDPEVLIKSGCLEKVEDFTWEKETIPASRLGYRITSSFLHMYFGRIFSSPTAVFTEEMLRPELQDRAAFADGVKNIVEAQQRVARNYFEDGSVEGAIPPLKALLHIMAHGSYDGKGTEDPEVASLFTKEYLLKSEWYHQRLLVKQHRDIDLMRRHIHYLTAFLGKESHSQVADGLGLVDKLHRAKEQLKRYQSLDYLRSLEGTIGADPLYLGRSR